MMKKIKATFICFLLFYWLNGLIVYAVADIPRYQEEVVDRIVALVNEEVITLTDVKIVKAFGFFSSEEAEVEIDNDSVLKNLIDQTLVIQLTREDTSAQDDTVDKFIDQIILKMGVEEFRKRLEQFGMTRTDLVRYASKWIEYSKIITERFKTATSISLKEIEDYYERTYIPAQVAKGLEAKPMLEILDEIEMVLKQKKSKMQVEEWLKNLRERADIQINL